MSVIRGIKQCRESDLVGKSRNASLLVRETSFEVWSLQCLNDCVMDLKFMQYNFKFKVLKVNTKMKKSFESCENIDMEED